MSRYTVGWHCVVLFGVFFFFQAEDGIRDVAVTGVQTCALPISSMRCAGGPAFFAGSTGARGCLVGPARSEERRVGKSVDLGGRRIIKKKKKKNRQIDPVIENKLNHNYMMSWCGVGAAGEMRS